MKKHQQADKYFIVQFHWVVDNAFFNETTLIRKHIDRYLDASS